MQIPGISTGSIFGNHTVGAPGAPSAQSLKDSISLVRSWMITFQRSLEAISLSHSGAEPTESCPFWAFHIALIGEPPFVESFHSDPIIPFLKSQEIFTGTSSPFLECLGILHAHRTSGVPLCNAYPLHWGSYPSLFRILDTDRARVTRKPRERNDDEPSRSLIPEGARDPYR